MTTADAPRDDALMARARARWIDKLTDVSRRNPLLYFREAKTSTLVLDFQRVRASALFESSAGLDELLPRDADPAHALVASRTMQRRSASLLEERGLATLFLALGEASWDVADQGRPPAAPLLLCPIRLEVGGRGAPQVRVELQGELLFNDVIGRAWGREARSALRAIAARVQQQDAAPLDLLAEIERALRPAAAAAGIEGLRIAPRAVIALFSFAKSAMVRDLEESGALLSDHPILRGLAGDWSRYDQRTPSPEPVSLDALSPREDFCVVDANASQAQVVQRVVDGASGIVHGPPGTGKSQTIVNLITSLIARGKRVLFVAEKRAALEVVKARLTELDLGHVMLDLHGADVKRSQSAKQLAAALEAIRTTPPVPADALDDEVMQRRAALVRHIERMRTVCPASGKTVRELYVAIRALERKRTPEMRARWRGADLLAMRHDVVDILEEQMEDAGTIGPIFLGQSRWSEALLATPEDARTIALHVQQLSTSLVTVWRDADEAGIHAPTMNELTSAARNMRALRAESAGFDTEALARSDVGALARALAPVRGGLVSFVLALLFSAPFRAARSTALAMYAGGGRLRAIAEQLASIALQLETKTGVAPYPQQHRGEAQLAAAVVDVDARLAAVGTAFGGMNLMAMQRPVLRMFIDALFQTIDDAASVPEARGLRAALHQAGLRALIDELTAEKIDPARWGDVLRLAWLRACLDAQCRQDPVLNTFTGPLHEIDVDAFRSADQAVVQRGAARVRRAHAEIAHAALEQYRDEAGVVEREAGKARRHAGVRELLLEAPHVVTQLCPCFLVSPLSVSQLLPARGDLFDVVIFDEASQVLPEDAVPAIMRAPQLVVAGDPLQLPPTAFFAGADDDGDVESGADVVVPDTTGIPSILDALRVRLPSWLLTWHYRSLDERLIAFSNHHIYDGALVTFPTANPQRAIQLSVAGEHGDDDEKSSASEVQLVVAAILEHARTTPLESLGVITMGVAHRDRIQSALDRALDRADPALLAFFDDTRPDRFFVKNLEQVQGDERDVVLLSVGYGKSSTGKVRHQFGPLNQAGGERRLNVAMTRARKRMRVFAAFTAEDLDRDRLKARGAQLLRELLAYAASAGDKLDVAHARAPVVSAIEADIADLLRGRGLRVVAQHGASAQRIDFAIAHPRDPNRLVLALESDGSGYEGAGSARERDRLRPQQLEKLGWKFARIWSTEWFERREVQIARVFALCEAALNEPAGALRTTTPTGAPVREAVRTLPPRQARPPLGAWTSTADVPEDVIVQLIAWARSDGLLRTTDDLVDEVAHEVGMKRVTAKLREKVARVLAQELARPSSFVERARAPGKPIRITPFEGIARDLL